MKKTLKIALALIVVFCTALCLFSCNRENKTTDETDIWSNATYKSDTELGEGEKTFAFEVIANEKTVRFTIHTNESNVGKALLACNLISGENGAYGLYVKVVNGITADYNVNQSYWSFNIDGQMSMNGVDATEIEEGKIYQFVYTK